MRHKLIGRGIVAIFLLAFCLAEDTDLSTKTKLPGTNDKCAAYCLATYSPHTSDEPKSADACQQGCRLFSMLQFTKDKSLENVQGSCDSACKEAYSNKGRREACFAGCHHQSPFTTGKMEIVVDKNSPISDYAHSLFDGMFDRMEQMHKSMMDSFRSYWPDSREHMMGGGMGNWHGMGMGNGWRGHHMMDDPSISQEMDKMHREMTDMMGDLLGRKKQKGNQQLNPLYKYGQSHKAPAGSEFEGKTVGNKDKNGNDILEVRMYYPTVRKGEHGETIFDFSPNLRMRNGHRERTGTLESARAFDPSPPMDRDPSRAVDPDAGWLACLARRARRLSSITRWLVCVALMLCVLCMIWICLSIMKTAPKRRVLYAKTEEVKACDISAEKKFLMESFSQPPPDGAPPPYQEEAEPIPVKAATA